MNSRCVKCNKKILLLPFYCKCTRAFCHRHISDHDCDFDYHADAKKTLARDNPKICTPELTKL